RSNQFATRSAATRPCNTVAGVARKPRWLSALLLADPIRKSVSWLIQNVLEIDRKVLIARVLLFLLALIIGRHIVDRLFLRNETRRLHHRAPAPQVGRDGGGELVGRLKLGVVADSGEAFDHLG